MVQLIMLIGCTIGLLVCFFFLFRVTMTTKHVEKKYKSKRKNLDKELKEVVEELERLEKNKNW